MKPRAMSLFRAAITPTSLAGMILTQLGRCPWSCFDRRLGPVRGGNPPDDSRAEATQRTRSFLNAKAITTARLRRLARACKPLSLEVAGWKSPRHRVLR